MKGSGLVIEILLFLVAAHILIKLSSPYNFSTAVPPLHNPLPTLPHLIWMLMKRGENQPDRPGRTMSIRADGDEDDL